MSFGLKLKTAAGAEPVLLDQFRRHTYFPPEDDAIATEKLAYARANVEGYLKRRLITQDWTVYFDRFAASLSLPIAPVQEVLEIRYRDESGALQTLDGDSWLAFVNSEPAYVCAAVGSAWPSTWLMPEAVEIDVRVGYGGSGDDVPRTICSAILREAASLFEYRESFMAGSGFSEVPGRFDDISGLIFHW